MALKAFGLYVATVPFPSNRVEAQVKNGMLTIKQTTSLQPLKVLAGSDKIPTGSTVYVQADHFRAPWALKLYDNNGTNFILVPMDQIILIDDRVENNDA